MGRKKKKQPAEKPTAVECNICSQDVLMNDPALGIIYMIAQNHAALCKDCGQMLTQVLDIARHRWG